MSDPKGFSDALAHDDGLKEADIAVTVAWFLTELDVVNPATMKSVCDFIEAEGIRANINRTRLQSRLNSRQDISAPKGKPLSTPAKTRKLLRKKYGMFLDAPLPEIDDTILELKDYADARQYVQAIARQINGSRQFEMYDACAVMMRRLVEVLIIDAYEAKGLRERTMDNGQYMMLNGMVGVLTSGQDFKLSRNVPKWLNQVKELGDNAAHSRTYITKKLDIDDFAGSYRKLISELAGLQNS